MRFEIFIGLETILYRWRILAKKSYAAAAIPQKAEFSPHFVSSLSHHKPLWAIKYTRVCLWILPLTALSLPLPAG